MLLHPYIIPSFPSFPTHLLSPHSLTHSQFRVFHFQIPLSPFSFLLLKRTQILYFPIFHFKSSTDFSPFSKFRIQMHSPKKNPSQIHDKKQNPKMIRLSNGLIVVLNILSFLLSLPILVAGIWLFRQSSSQCDQFLAKPMIVAGVFLMVVSVAGIIGSCCRVSWLLWFYILVMFLLILLLFCFTVFAFVVTNKGAGTAVSDRGYKEYRLGDYSDWLRKRVSNTKKWNRIKSCLEDSKICTNFISEKNGTEVKDLYKKHLSAIESGCCILPEVCNFTYVMLPANWTQTADSNLTDPDCRSWGNELTVRCYNCESCKAGMIDNIKTDWKKVAVINTIFLFFLVIIYSIGCCAFRNILQDNSGKNP